MSTLTTAAKQGTKAVLGEQTTQRLHQLLQVPVPRIRSGLTSDGRRSSRLLTRCRDEFRGRRAIIIGNGPSLRETDLSLLKGEYTFGLNRFYLAFDELGFETTFLVSINELLISQVADELAAVGSRKFFRWSSRELFSPEVPDLAFLQPLIRPGFSPDIRHGLWEGATVTYVALQLAFHLGFSTVVLIGVDHNFVTQGPANQEVESTGDDPNHFHPGYFGRGFRWQLPDLETSEIAYRMARHAYESDGRQVLDATVGGKLRIFPRVALEQVLSTTP
jgi:hypothetical protein